MDDDLGPWEPEPEDSAYRQRLRALSDADLLTEIAAVRAEVATVARWTGRIWRAARTSREERQRARLRSPEVEVLVTAAGRAEWR